MNQSTTTSVRTLGGGELFTLPSGRTAQAFPRAIGCWGCGAGTPEYRDGYHTHAVYDYGIRQFRSRAAFVAYIEAIDADEVSR